MAIFRRLNMLPFGSNGLHNNNSRKRKHCEVSLPSVETTSASSSSDDDYSSDSDNSVAPVTSRSVIVVSPPLGTRVHFAEDVEDDEDDSLLEEDDCPPPAADLDYLQEHKADLWYAKDARQGFQKEALETIQNFKSEQPQRVSQFGALYRQPKSATEADTAIENKDPSVSTLQLPLTMRGLEWGITPTLKKKRQHHVRQVLLACDIADDAKRERAIAARARKSSRIACSVAHKLAVGSDIVFLYEDDCSYNSSSSPDCDNEVCDDSTANKAVTGLPPREPLQSKRMRLWQR